jgi:hypothetical protein
MLNKWPTAGVIAGIVLYFWGAVTHMAFNIDNHIQPVPNDAAVIEALQGSLKEPGVYFYPNEPDPEKLGELTKTKPWGLVTYSPAGKAFSMGSSLGVQFGLDLGCGLIAAFLFSMAAPALGGMGRKLLFTVLIGLFATVAIQGAYWNWYGFPAVSVLTSAFEAGVGCLLMGLVFAKLIK